MSATEEPNLDQKRLAMLIDYDNAEHSEMDKVLEAANKFGKVTIRRAYGCNSLSELVKLTDSPLKLQSQGDEQPLLTVE